MPKRKTQRPKSLSGLVEYESFLNILRYYVDLNCFIISEDPGDGTQGWRAAHYHQRPVSLFDFEKKYGTPFNWKPLTDPKFEARHGPKTPLLLRTLGFTDIFMPIRTGSRRLGTLLSGAFSEHEITLPQLKDSWRNLSGQTPASENPEFRHFVRALLDTPVLEGPVLEAYREALELFAGLLAREDAPGASERLRELVTEVFSKHFPHSYWVDWALGLPTRQATPLWNKGVTETEWVRKDIRIERIPTTVLAAIPVGPVGVKRDPVEEMVRIYRFQRRCFQFARTLPQTVGGKLENYGALFITSTSAQQGRIRRREEIRELARRIQDFASAESGGPVRVGIGEPVPPGEALTESFRQAVLALHLDRDPRNGLAVFKTSPAGEPQGVLELVGLLRDLRARLEAAEPSGVGAGLEEFLKKVLILTFQNPGEVRLHLQYGLDQICEALRTRAFLDPAEVREVQKRLVGSIEEAATTQELVERFQDAVEKVAFLLQKRSDFQSTVAIEKIRDHVAERFRDPLRIGELSRLAGFSASTLSRHFKSHVGVGLQEYLQDLRIKEAKRLLATGNLPISQVARSCGYRPGTHFARFFKSRTGFTPQKFRQRRSPA